MFSVGLVLITYEQLTGKIDPIALLRSLGLQTGDSAGAHLRGFLKLFSRLGLGQLDDLMVSISAL
jgi:hypothetical protein